MIADWTDYDNWVIAETVHAYGQAGIPLYLIIPGDGDKPAIQLTDAVTPGEFIKALEQGAR